MAIQDKTQPTPQAQKPQQGQQSQQAQPSQQGQGQQWQHGQSAPNQQVNQGASQPRTGSQTSQTNSNKINTPNQQK